MTITWQQFAAIPNGTRIFNHGADQCVALANHYHENVIGGAFIPVGSAHQWWTGNWAEINRLYTKSLFPVTGAIFIAQGGIYDRVYGHIGVVTGVNANGSFNTMEQNAGTGSARWTWRFTRANDNSIWGFLIPKNNPATAKPALTATQRQAYSGAGNDVRRRQEPTSKSKDLGDPIPAGDVGNFNGWINGEVVNGNGVWFRGISGHWFWSGGFTSQSKSGLKDLNPAPAPTNKRKAQDLPVNIRSEAKTSAKVVGSVNAKQEVSVVGWLNGEKVSSIDTWYKLSNGFAWAGGFTDSSTNGITKYVPPVKPEPEPEHKPEPELPPLKAFSPVVSRVDAAHRDNIMLEPFSKAQTDVVLHDFGTDGKDTFAGTVSWFKNPKAAASAHFVVSGTNIVQMVSLEHRAQHAGPQGNNHVGIEIDPAVGRSGNDQLKIDTIASVRKLLIALRDHYGVQLKTHKHSEFMSTECGDDIDLQAYDISEPVKPDDSEINTKLDNILSLLQKLTDMFKAIFRIN